ncbi:PRA1 family protein D [Linum perenne]
MAGYGTIQQRANSTTSSGSDSQLVAADLRRPEFHIVCPFNIPSSPEVAARRITRNLSQYRLHYIHFVWIVLFITLIPSRKVSLICLVFMTYVASLYLLILRTFPASYFLNKLIDKRLVLSLIVVMTILELIFTKAALHLFITLAATIHLVLIHAALWIGEHIIAEEKEAAEEFLPIVQETGVASKRIIATPFS